MMQFSSIDLAPDVSSLFDGFDGNLAQYRDYLEFSRGSKFFFYSSFNAPTFHLVSFLA